MTGPEHYRKAEELMDQVRKSQTTMRPASPDSVKNAFAQAQVHATLALAAAQALGSTHTRAMRSADWDAWLSAAGEGAGRAGA